MSTAVQIITAEEQALKLEESLSVIRQQESAMRKCLESKGKLMDALKHAANFLAELRTSLLSPKQYYELYIAVFDALSYLGAFLKDNHNTYHLADLYELVQYTGNIVPRLYLMITVGTVYMSVPGAPVKEIMKDMMEMCRGVQHPIRGLFLRYYLSQGARDYLPVGNSDGIEGNLEDSVKFVITNFIEMNKLWVRLQHQGHSRQREKRIKERKELQILVGSNLVRLSQLEGIDKHYYRETILPAILEQVVQCRDVIAQEYLLDVISQVFPDEFHLFTLDLFLNATANLNPDANVKKIILTLVNRLAEFSAREAENEKATADKATSDEQEVTEKLEKSTLEDYDENEKEEKLEPNEPEVEVRRGVPVNIDLFEIFWSLVAKLLEARPNLTISDITALYVGIARLSLNCYPERTENIDKILELVLNKLDAVKDTPEAHSEATVGNVLELLELLINSFSRLLTVLELKHFLPLLSSQPGKSQKVVAGAVVDSGLRSKNHIETVEEAEGVFNLIHILIVNSDGNTGTNAKVSSGVSNLIGDSEGEEELDETKLSAETLANQSKLAKVVHLLRNRDTEVQAKLLTTARKALAEGKQFVQFTYPALVFAALRLVRRVPKDSDQLGSLFKFIQYTIGDINRTGKSNKALRLFVDAGAIADQVGAEEASYELYAQAFSIYEEGISDSRAQYQAICILASSLQSTRHFSEENYDTLVSKCALYGSKLLKKPDQCRAVYLASHLWWGVEIPALGEQEETSEFFRDGKRVFECLQRALRVADGCMDLGVSVELFVEILNRSLYYFERGNEQVTAKFIVGLIELIQRNLENVKGEAQSQHFERTLQYIEEQKASEDEEESARYQTIVY